MINPIKDPIETTICIDYDTKSLHCWSSHLPTMRQWLKNFPSYCKANSYSVEMNNLPIALARKIKVNPRTVFSEEEREIRRERGLTLAKLRVTTNDN